METRVVNVKVQYIRPQYNDLQEWTEDPNNVYIGRAGIVFVTRNGRSYRYPQQDSIWANPYKINKSNPDQKRARWEALNNYVLYMNDKLEKGEITIQQLMSLRGKNLGCWCKEPGKNVRCHGDILLQYLALL